MSLILNPANTPSEALWDATQLQGLVHDLLLEATSQGATSAEAGLTIESGLSVTVRLGEVETIEHNRDKALGVTVYFGHRKGSASTSDFSAQAVRETVRAACNIARYTAEDDCAGLADAALMAREIPDLDLYYPWQVSAEHAIVLATECEDSARALDKRITNSEGASLSSHQGLNIYGNSHGFIGGYPTSRHSLSCAVIGQSESGMQRDYWFSVARDHNELETPGRIGEHAAQRTLRRLDGRRLSTRQAPVVFEAPAATSLLSHLMSAIRGGSLYRKASFLLDHLGKQIFPAHVHIHEQPHLKKALGSAPFDNEGVATAAHDFVRGGVLESYVLDSYSARKLGMQTTGNAGGVHNLFIDPGSYDLDGLLRLMGKGLLVTELIGMGVNTVTGDYSRGVAGFWVEHGEIQYPVEEITIAGNLLDIFLHLAEVGKDVDVRGNIRTGSILIENMTIAGE
ncbi:MAG TPA: metalloprotease PmbA [Gammaproteobacteria bacterium]|nr:metalloprotease PmbA [Gammaproteobacteria bacterium]